MLDAGNPKLRARLQQVLDHIVITDAPTVEDLIAALFDAELDVWIVDDED